MKKGIGDFPIANVGLTVPLVGGVWRHQDTLYAIVFPEHHDEGIEGAEILFADLEEWNAIIRQSDVLETEVLARAKDGKIVKAVIRKSQRQIGGQVSWNVFRRDGFACRYCGAQDRPLTVDHLVLWEEGGPSIEENLVAACKKCNKTRGNTPYEDWLNHPHYLRVSRNLPRQVRETNEAVAKTLKDIPRVIHKRTKR